MTTNNPPEDEAEKVARELEPCPFCNGEVRLVDPNIGSGMKVATTYPRYPFCDNCNVEFIFGGRSEHMMRKRFNQRAGQAVGEARKLKELKESIRESSELRIETLNLAEKQAEQRGYQRALEEAETKCQELLAENLLLSKANIAAIEAERRGEERGAEGMFRAMLTLDGLPWSDKPIHPSWVRTICIPPKKAAMKAFDDWRASEEYKEGK